MAEKIGVIIIEKDELSRRFIHEIVQGNEMLRVVGEASDLGNGFDLVRKFHPAILIVELSPSIEKGLSFVEKVFRQYPKTILFVSSQEKSQDVIIEAMRAGAREFLKKPFKREDLEQALRTAVHSLLSSMNVSTKRGKIISVFGVKGGVGATTVATNLAVGLASQAKKRIILVDLNLQLGNAALFLDLKPKYSIIDMAQNFNIIDKMLLQQNLARHNTGVVLLAGPQHIEDAEVLTVYQVDQIISMLTTSFDYVVVDLPKVFDDLTMKVLDISDSVLTLFNFDIPSLSNAFRCFEIFKKLEYSREKILPIITRFDNNSSKTMHEVEKSIKYPLFWKIPNQNYTTMINATNDGEPIIISHSRQQIGKSFIGLTDLIIQRNSDEEVVIKERKGLFQNLFAWK